jgi:hypothetical protein
MELARPLCEAHRAAAIAQKFHDRQQSAPNVSVLKFLRSVATV